MSDAQSKAAIDFEEQLRGEFLGETKDRLNNCQCALYELTKDDDEKRQNLLRLHHEVHAIKGMAASFGFPSITMIAHKMEDYLSDATDYDERCVSDVQTFLDRLSEIVDQEEDLGSRTAEVLKSLPQRRSFDTADIELRDVEVLVVTPARAVKQGVSRELQACGYRVTFANSSIQALEFACTLKPAMVIVAATLDVLSGFDLVRALAAMDATDGVRVGLLTSFDSDHPDLKRLPADTQIIRLGGNLRDDLGNMIADFESLTGAAA